MTLTEKYRKGELPRSKLYYVKNNNEIFYCYLDSNNDFIHYGGIIYPEVLAEVPSFELWKAVHEQWKVLLEENAKLKELLKECRNKWVCYKPYDRDQLLKRIDKILADNKIQANTVACNKIQENE